VGRGPGQSPWAWLASRSLGGDKNTGARLGSLIDSADAESITPLPAYRSGIMLIRGIMISDDKNPVFLSSV
jgi:hypothetical protein